MQNSLYGSGVLSAAVDFGKNSTCLSIYKPMPQFQKLGKDLLLWALQLRDVILAV